MFVQLGVHLHQKEGFIWTNIHDLLMKYRTNMSILYEILQATWLYKSCRKATMVNFVWWDDVYIGQWIIHSLILDKYSLRRKCMLKNGNYVFFAWKQGML